MDLLSGYSDSGRPVPTSETFDDVLARAVAKTQEARGDEPAGESQQPPAPTPRDPDTGQFVAPGVTEPVVVEETPAQSVQFEGESGDPEIAAFLAKYGATNVDPAVLPPEVVKALKGGVEAQKLAGRHAKELGELRKQQTAAPEPGQAQQPQAPAAPVAFPQQGEIEVAEQWVEEHGFAATAETLLGAYGRDDLYNILLDRAIRSGDPDLAGEAFQWNQWYEAQLAQHLVSQTPGGPAPAAEAPAPQSGDDLSPEEFQVTYERVKTNVPDFGTVEPLLEDALKAVPEETRQAFVSPVEAERELALYQVVNVARRIAAQQGAAAATGEARAQARVAAQVASGSLRPVGDGAPAEGSREAKIKAAKDAIFRGDNAFDLSKGYSGIA